MKTLQVNDEVYERLKTFVVDPFEDTPNVVLMRLIDIASEAQNCWSPLASSQKTENAPTGSVPLGTRIPDTASEGSTVML